MKTCIIFSFLLAFVTSALSCDHGESASSSTSTTPGEVASSGTWRVSLFSERGDDETSDFAGYAFTFNTNGTLLAVKAGVTATGTWSTSTGSSPGKFNINLGPKTDANKPLGELTDDWKIISNTITEIKLTDDNVSSDEFLTFSKN